MGAIYSPGERKLFSVSRAARMNRFRVSLSRWTVCLCAGGVLAVVLAGPSIGHLKAARKAVFPLDSVHGLELLKGKAEITPYKGRTAVRLVVLPDHQTDDEIVMATISGIDFHNGTIEADVAGAPHSGTRADFRGFIGISFRVQDSATKFENMYLRPTNGRAEDQLRRNHSVQYESIPDFPWYRLRKESPGMYESYADLESGEWTHMKIVVSGAKAELYLNGAASPCLIVNDLKLGESHGQVALWAHWSTDAYFSNLSIEAD